MFFISFLKIYIYIYIYELYIYIYMYIYVKEATEMTEIFEKQNICFK